MRTIRKFEDIEAWQMARELANFVYEATSERGFSSDFALRDQIRRAAISIVSNIAEGYERDGDREFA
jgi:four helix bundle protein